MQTKDTKSMNVIQAIKVMKKGEKVYLHGGVYHMENGELFRSYYSSFHDKWLTELQGDLSIGECLSDEWLPHKEGMR